MSTSAPEAPGPSRARPEASAAAVPPQPRRGRWILLSAIPAVADPDERARLLLGDDVERLALDIQPAPRASYLVLSKRAVPDPKLPEVGLFPYVHAADPSGVLLFNATRNRGADPPVFFLGDALTGVASPLPVPADPRYFLRPRRGVGLIADPRRRAAYLVGQLEPYATVATRHRALLCHSTATGSWELKPLASAPEQERRWRAQRALAHDGLLWWVDVAYGLLVCDPFLDLPRLRFVPLPPGSEIQCDVVVHRDHRTIMDGRRFVRLSEGKLSYVEIRGGDPLAEHLDNPTLRLWTLVDDPDAQHRWDLEYEVPLADVWAHDTYIAAGLAPSVVPKLGLVHPYNRRMVYMFQGAKLFALDVRTRRVLACQECRIDNDPELRFQSCSDVYAWELPPLPLAGRSNHPDAGAGTSSPAVTANKRKLEAPAPAGRPPLPPPPAAAVEATATYTRRTQELRARIRRHLTTGPVGLGNNGIFRGAAYLIRDLLSTTVPIQWHHWVGEAQLRYVLPGGQIRKGRTIGLLTRTADFLDARHV